MAAWVNENTAPQIHSDVEHTPTPDIITNTTNTSLDTAATALMAAGSEVNSLASQLHEWQVSAATCFEELENSVDWGERKGQIALTKCRRMIQVVHVVTF